MTEVKIKRIPKFSLSTAPDLLSMALWALLSFGASRAMLFGEISPFGASAVAAANRNNAFGAVLGAVLGYISSGQSENALRSIGAVLVVFGAKLVLERFTSGDIFSVLVAAGATAFSSFGYAAVTVISGYTSLTALAETVLAAGAAYFFKRTAAAFEHGKPLVTLSPSDRACAVMTLSIAAASFSGVALGKINIGSIIASLLVLLSARYGKESGGAVAGVACGTVISLSTGNLSTAVPAYGVGGLMGGIFSVFGKVGCALSFTAVRFIIAVLSTEHYPDYSPVFESLIAAAIFMLIPEKAGKYISNVTLYDEKSADSATVKDLVLSKMGRAADGLYDIGLATKKVAASLEHENFTETNSVLNSAAEKFCGSCPKNFECWKAKRESTVAAFYEMASAAKEKREPLFAEDFAAICPKTGLLFNDIKIKIKEAARKNSEERRIKNIREVVTEQFDSMALLLKDIAADAATVKSVDKKLSLAVKNIFEGRNIPLFASTCYYSADGIVNIEVSGAKERLKNADIRNITEEIADLCDCDMAKPVVRDTENARRLFFCEKPLMEAEFGVVSINAAGEKFCGDCAEHFTDQYGCAHLVLSDGMGSGEHAALDSMMTSGLVARLVRAGFRFGSAIKLVNSALLLKSEDESLATVDAFSVNLYTGCANFYKAGAESSFVLKNGRTSKVESCSLPAGILSGAEYEQSSMNLSIGDIAVLITDGVTFGGGEWIPSELRSLAEKPAEEIAKGIAQTANKRRTDGHSDDITVAVIKLISAY